MPQVIDFTDCRRLIRVLGGTERKFEIKYNGTPYILKFSEKYSNQSDMPISYKHNTTAEYICSHISASMELPTHETVLGMYEDRPVVGCLDFRKKNEQNYEFNELVRACFDPSEVKRVIRLDQIYYTINNTECLTEDLKRASIERYWDTFGS